MSDTKSGLWPTIQAYAQTFALGLVILLATGLVTTTLLAAFGVLPWLRIEAGFGTAILPEAGMYLQVFLTLFALSLAFYLPSSWRIMRLENSHRAFRISMEDVAAAYALSHKGDRSGVFNLSSEFDSVRARIEHLRNHPDLASLEPGLLEVAAQMSHQSREMAEVYSDEHVARAKTFLAQRQEEIETFQDQIATAQMTCDELKRWLADVESEERVASGQLERLEADLKELLPTIGYNLEEEEDDNVVPIAAKPTK